MAATASDGFQFGVRGGLVDVLNPFAVTRPVWLLGSFYSTWLIAWIQLGHLPRPMLDDPKSIGGVMEIAYFVSGILVMTMPVLTPIGLIASFFCPISTRRTARYALKAALAVLYVALCALVLLTLRTDPGRVVEWWFD